MNVNYTDSAMLLIDLLSNGLSNLVLNNSVLFALRNGRFHITQSWLIGLFGN